MQPHVVTAPLGDNPPTATLYYGQSALVSLRALPDNSVDMACTSPPYWGLRRYISEGTMRLRSDLTSEEVEFVLRELVAAGVSTGTLK
ncbi:MAG: hypothetical protein A2Y38_02745 [Spirochaetes bacterium GWB1_59_5]|nr:MAG: hypothetical protein A2Y38_02745 [Spirochaetes bacterium GWB1_59_5]